MADRMMHALDACEAALFTDFVAAEDDTAVLLTDSPTSPSGSGAAAAKALRTGAKVRRRAAFSEETLSKLLSLVEDCSHIELPGNSSAASSSRCRVNVSGAPAEKRYPELWGTERFLLELAPGQKPNKDTRIRDGREVAIFLKRSRMVRDRSVKKDEEDEKEDEDGEEEDDDEDEDEEAEDFWDDEGFSEDASVPPVRLWLVSLREVMENGHIVSKSKAGPEEGDDKLIEEGHDGDSASDSGDDEDSDREGDRDREDDDYDDEAVKQVLLKRPELANSVTGMCFVLKHVEQKKLERFDDRLFHAFLVQDYDTCAAESLTAACNAICGENKYSTEDIFDIFGKVAVRKLGGKSASDPALNIKKTDDKNTKRLKRMVKNYRHGGRWEATWDVGNSDIEDAAVFFLGLKATRFLGRNWMSTPPPKGSREEAAKKDEVWLMLKEHFWEGSKCNNGVFLFHLQGYETGHYTLIFGLREVYLASAASATRRRPRGRGHNSLRRDIFTSTYGQKPKHWMSLDRLYNMLFHHKFTGYAIIKLEPR